MPPLENGCMEHSGICATIKTIEQWKTHTEQDTLPEIFKAINDLKIEMAKEVTKIAIYAVIGGTVLLNVSTIILKKAGLI